MKKRKNEKRSHRSPNFVFPLGEVRGSLFSPPLERLGEALAELGTTPKNHDSILSLNTEKEPMPQGTFADAPR